MKFTFAPESTPLPGYTIKRAIQRGGFGEVYYALTDGGKEVALKLLQNNPDIEIRGTRQCLNLKHQNLVTIFDIKSDDDGDVWVVMEYVTGQGLDRVLAENFPDGMPPEEARWWLAGLADGVGYLHDRGIVHRDLKPANLYREGGLVKVGDIGLSKIITPSQRGAQTESIGTVYYMAPEVSRGEYGREVDVYSTAVVLYELLTGRVPFDGETTAEILMKHLSEEPDLSPLPIRFRPVLAHELTKDPTARTPTLEQLLKEFDAAETRPTSIEPPPSTEPPVVGTVDSARDGIPTTDDAVLLDNDAPPTRPKPVTRPGRPPRTASISYLPLSLRPIPLPQRMMEMTAAMTAAIPFTALLATGIWLLGMSHDDPLAAVAYGLTTLVAAWAILCSNKIWEGTGRESLHLRRLSLLCLGGGVGAVSWWFHQVLLLDLPSIAADQGSALVSSIGSLELVHGSQPTLAGYVMFFALLFGMRRWWWHTDTFRPRRLRVASLVLTLAVSCLLALVLGFPFRIATSWAVGISVVVQLAAPWISPENRQAYMEVTERG